MKCPRCKSFNKDGTEVCKKCSFIMQDEYKPEKCKRCGEASKPFQYSSMPEMAEMTLCFSCAFWHRKLSRKDKVIINGDMYSIGPKTSEPNNWKGFSGRPFKIKFFDGRIIETNNLWHSGTIPEHFKEELPDNAEFI